MAINFDALVVTPCMNAFAIPCTVTPLASIPKAPTPYQARGIYSLKQIDLLLEDGTRFFSVTITFGMRLAELPALPVAGDTFVIAPSGKPLNYVVDHVGGDGQGGINVFMKSKQASILPIPVIQALYTPSA